MLQSLRKKNVLLNFDTKMIEIRLPVQIFVKYLIIDWWSAIRRLEQAKMMCFI